MDQIDNPEELKRHYQQNSVATGYEDERFSLPKNLHVHGQQIRITNTVLRDAACRSVLELACGPGRVTRYIDGDLTGVAVDASAEMLTIAHRVLDRDRWETKQADIFALDLKRSFDAVVTFRFIRHFRRADRERIYAVIHRHLDNGGLLVFDAPNRVAEEPFRAKHPELYPIYDELWTEESLRNELVAAGFHGTVLHPMLTRHDLQRVISFATKRGLNELGARLIGWIDRWPGGEPLEWTVICRR